jgi:hypothetical protein
MAIIIKQSGLKLFANITDQTRSRQKPIGMGTTDALQLCKDSFILTQEIFQ